MEKIIVASGNKGKLKEIMEILHGFDIELISMNDFLGYTPEIPETGSTFLQNAKMKADWIFEKTGVWTLADDSGLEVDALDGAPGVFSARFAGENADSKQNNEKLLHLLAGIPLEKRTARFRCVIVLITGVNSCIVADGACEGAIIDNYKGDGGFGYDPLFIPDGYNKTFAELESSIKNTISHRGIALRKLKEQLEEMHWKR